MKKETTEDVMEFFHSVLLRSPVDPKLSSNTGTSGTPSQPGMRTVPLLSSSHCQSLTLWTFPVKLWNDIELGRSNWWVLGVRFIKHLRFEIIFFSPLSLAICPAALSKKHVEGLLQQVPQCPAGRTRPACKPCPRRPRGEPAKTAERHPAGSWLWPQRSPLAAARSAAGVSGRQLVRGAARCRRKGSPYTPGQSSQQPSPPL